MSTKHPSRGKIPTRVPSAMAPGLADTDAGELIRASDASSRARESLVIETEQLKTARNVAETGSYRLLDKDGNPANREIEQLRVASQILALERSVANAKLELDSAEAFEESLDNAKL